MCGGVPRRVSLSLPEIGLTRTGRVTQLSKLFSDSTPNFVEPSSAPPYVKVTSASGSEGCLQIGRKRLSVLMSEAQICASEGLPDRVWSASGSGFHEVERVNVFVCFDDDRRDAWNDRVVRFGDIFL